MGLKMKIGNLERFILAFDNRQTVAPGFSSPKNPGKNSMTNFGRIGDWVPNPGDWRYSLDGQAGVDSAVVSLDSFTTASLD